MAWPARSLFSKAAGLVALWMPGKLRLLRWSRLGTPQDAALQRCEAKPGQPNNFSATVFFRCGIPLFVTEYRRIALPRLATEKRTEISEWRHWTRSDKRSRSCPIGLPGSTPIGQRWPIN